MQWLMSNIQFLIFAIVILSSILGPVFKWLGEKRKQMRQENERKRRELEEFRTGRVEQTGPTPEQIEQLIAEQLAAQRAELLRQRAEQAEVRRRAAQQRAEQAKLKQQKKATQVQASGKVVEASRTYAEASNLATPPMIPIEAMGSQIHAKRKAAVSTRRAPSATIVGKLGPQELRRAIVLTEIIGPPVSLR